MSQPNLDIGKVIDSRPLSGLQIRVIVLCSLVALVDGYDIQALALAVPSLSQEWGIEAAMFKFAQSASLIGIAFSSVFLGPLGDRFGRKPVMIAGLLFMGGASLGVMLSTDPTHIAFWRGLVGVGYGAIHGNATALTAEYAPARSRAMLMTLMGCNVALGAMIAGFTAPWVLDTFGWQGLFLIGGIAPVILAVVMLTSPDSLHIMIARRRDDPRIARALARIAPDVDPATVTPLPRISKGKHSSVMDLLRPPLLERTLRLWLIYGFNTFLLYLMISWLPVLLTEAGWSRNAAVQAIVPFQLGGICGGLLLSLLVDRGQAVVALIVGYALAAVAAVMFVVVPASETAWLALILVLGAGISGAMFALNAVAAILYPPTVRAAGFSWNAAVSRIGAVLGPLIGGWSLGIGVPTDHIFAWIAVPTAASAVIALSLRGTLARIRAAEAG